MAKSTYVRATTRIIKEVVEVEKTVPDQPEKFVLELTREEAEFLRADLGTIPSGGVFEPWRQIHSNIWAALVESGVPKNHQMVNALLVGRSNLGG